MELEAFVVQAGHELFRHGDEQLVGLDRVGEPHVRQPGEAGGEAGGHAVGVAGVAQPVALLEHGHELEADEARLGRELAGALAAALEAAIIGARFVERWFC